MSKTDKTIQLAVQPPDSQDWIPIGTWLEGASELDSCCETYRREARGAIVQNVPRDLFPFMCIRPTDAYQLGSLPPGFVICTDPQSLPLYEELQKLKGQPDAPENMRTAAQTFIEGDDFVSSLSKLDSPMSQLAAIGLKILAITGDVTLDELTNDAKDWLGMPLNDFFNDKAYITGRPKVWQSLFALALSGSATQVALSDQLTAVVRVLDFLTRLSEGQTCLQKEAGRLTVLSAIPAYPDAVAPGPLPAQATKAGSQPNDGWLRLLGVGDLKLVQHSLKGYIPGELASTVNIMPHERRREIDRSLSREEQSTVTDEGTTEARRSESAHESGSDLNREVQELIGAECASGDLSNVTPSYCNLNVILSGKWSTDETISTRADALAARYAQRISERAADKLTRKVLDRRSVTRVEEIEKSLKREFDNSAGDDPIVGFYRWLDKVIELQVVNRGRRLVIEFMLPTPAASYIEYSKEKDGIPLVEPQPLAAFSEPDGWEQITPCNYQQYALQYRVGPLPPPPQDTLVVSQTLCSQPPKGIAEIVVPPGYETSGGSLSYILSDKTCALAGYVGSDFFVINGTGNSALPSEKPASSPSLPIATEGEGCPAPSRQSPRPPPTPVSKTRPISFAAGPQRGAIPIAILSAAGSFYVSAELTCSLINPSCSPSTGGEAAGDSPSLALELWQRKTLDALREAYDLRLQEYKRALEERIEKNSTGRTGLIQREQLTQSAYAQLAALLFPSPNSDGPPPGYLRFFERAFEWADSAHRYYPWATGIRPPNQCTWPCECTLNPNSDPLFKAFLNANSARVTATVTPGYEIRVLFYLLYGTAWVGDSGSTPITEGLIPLIFDRSESNLLLDEDVAPVSWTVNVSTDLLVVGKETLLPENGGQP